MRHILIFSILVLFFLGCTRTEAEEATLKNFGDGAPIKEAFHVKFVFSENAIVQAELEAPHAIEAKENGQDIRIFDRGLHMTFYTPAGEKQSELTSIHGKFKNQFNDATVWGDVLMINGKGDRLTADTLFWNKTKNRIRAKPMINPHKRTVERPVMIKTATENIYGDSLDANTEFTEYKIWNIRGSLDVKEDGM
jgi:hypothetical protein